MILPKGAAYRRIGTNTININQEDRPVYFRTHTMEKLGLMGGKCCWVSFSKGGLAYLVRKRDLIEEDSYVNIIAKHFDI